MKHESEIESDIDLLQTDDEDDFEDDDSDMDENGNLKGFIVDEDEKKMMSNNRLKKIGLHFINGS